MYICIEPLQPAPWDLWPRARALNSSGRPHAFSQKAQRAKSELLHSQLHSLLFVSRGKLKG